MWNIENLFKVHISSKFTIYTSIDTLYVVVAHKNDSFLIHELNY